MNKMLTAIAVSTVTAWAVGYSAMASAEAEFYGRVVAGAYNTDPDTATGDSAWNLGATGKDGNKGFLNSRFGFKGSSDLGNGLEAGFKIEREIDDGNSTSQRHNLVYLSGGFGTVTLGNQGNPYMSARKWDQTNLFGGGDSHSPGYRNEGIGYSMSTSGFNFDVMAMAHNDENLDDNAATTNDAGQNTGADGWVVRAGYNFGAVNLDVATQTNNTKDEDARDSTAIGVNGAAGPVDWYLAYQTSELSNVGDEDINSLGGFVGFNMSESDILYAYYVTHAHEQTGAADIDETETIFGYSRQIGPGVKFIAEYQQKENDEGDKSTAKPSQLGLAVKMDF